MPTADKPAFSIRVRSHRGAANVEPGMRWEDQLTATTWDVVEPSGESLYSPSGFGGTLLFWCRAVAGVVPASWRESARADGCIEFCGDSIVAGYLRSLTKDDHDH